MPKKKPSKPAPMREGEARQVPPAGSPELAHILPQLQLLAVPVESLVLDPANANEHDPASIGAIAASLKAYGHRKPLVVNEAGNVVQSGNGQLLAARQLGWSWIAAVFVRDDPATAAGWSIADNRTAQLSTWNEDALLALIETASLDADLADALLLDQLTQELAAAAEAEPADPEENLGGGEQVIPDKYSLVIECEGADAQKALWDELSARGLKCRPLTV